MNKNRNTFKFATAICLIILGSLDSGCPKSLKLHLGQGVWQNASLYGRFLESEIGDAENEA